MFDAIADIFYILHPEKISQNNSAFHMIFIQEKIQNDIVQLISVFIALQ